MRRSAAARRGANSGRLAIWVGGDKAVFDKYKPVLDAMGDAARYIGPIGAGSIAKLVHNAAGAAVNIGTGRGVHHGREGRRRAAAAVGGDPPGRRRTRPTVRPHVPEHFLTGTYDPPDFALRLLHKDVSLACQLAREVGVPMRLTNLAHQELTEALGRGWGSRDCRVGMLLQQERAGIDKIAVSPDRLKAVLDADK